MCCSLGRVVTVHLCTVILDSWHPLFLYVWKRKLGRGGGCCQRRVASERVEKQKGWESVSVGVRLGWRGVIWKIVQYFVGVIFEWFIRRNLLETWKQTFLDILRIVYLCFANVLGILLVLFAVSLSTTGSLFHIYIYFHFTWYC